MQTFTLEYKVLIRVGMLHAGSILRAAGGVILNQYGERAQLQQW